MRAAWPVSEEAVIFVFSMDAQRGAHLLARRFLWSAPHPIILYECQNKGITKIAFPNLLILKDAIWVVLD
jgi:hypothetical protein